MKVANSRITITAQKTANFFGFVAVINNKFVFVTLANLAFSILSIKNFHVVVVGHAVSVLNNERQVLLWVFLAPPSILLVHLVSIFSSVLILPFLSTQLTGVVASARTGNF